MKFAGISRLTFPYPTEYRTPDSVPLPIAYSCLNPFLIEMACIKCLQQLVCPVFVVSICTRKCVLEAFLAGIATVGD